MTPAERLRALIVASTIPDAEIARRAGMSASRLSQIKTGVKADPQASTVEAILVALGLDWSAMDGPFTG